MNKDKLVNVSLLIRCAEKVKKGTSDAETLRALNFLIEELEHAPTVDAAPVVHGRWIPLEYDGYADGNPVWDLWECSECREEHSGDEDTLTPYCPNCGAKMDGDGNG